MEIVQVPKEQMDEKFLADLHKSIFDHALPGGYFRFDICMIAKNDNGDLVSYALARELNSNTVELAWGGTSKEFRGISSKMAMEKFTEKCLEVYDSVVFQTWNKNDKMIRLGLRFGFIIVGTRVTDDNDLMVIFSKRRG